MGPPIRPGLVGGSDPRWPQGGAGSARPGSGIDVDLTRA